MGVMKLVAKFSTGCFFWLSIRASRRAPSLQATTAGCANATLGVTRGQGRAHQHSKTGRCLRDFFRLLSVNTANQKKKKSLVIACIVHHRQIRTGFKLLTWSEAGETLCVLQLAVLTLQQYSRLLPAVLYHQVITQAVTLLIYPLQVAEADKLLSKFDPRCCYKIK